MGELIGPEVERAFATHGLILYRGELNGICGKEGRSGPTRLWARGAFPFTPYYGSSVPGERINDGLIKRMIRKQPNRVCGGPAPIRSALLGGAYHRSDGLALPEARIKSLGPKAAVALESNTASVLREPLSKEPSARLSSSAYAASCPGRVLA